VSRRELDRRALVGGAWAAVALQLVVLYAPEAPDLGADLIPFADKLVHCLVFGLATALWARLSRRVWVVAAVFAVHAALSEVAQGAWLPGRSGDALDVAADLVGVALGVWVGLAWHRGLFKGPRRRGGK
jgi:VanZ family protein